MKTFQAQHLTTGDVAKIAKLSYGKFDDTVLYRLVSALSTSFEAYSPDNTVMVYLKRHSQALRWEHKFEVRPPKEKERDSANHKQNDSSSNQKDCSVKRKDKSEHKSSKSKRIKMTEKASSNPKRIKTSDQRRRKSCCKGGTHKSHSHDDCKLKERYNTKFTNLGKASAKKQRNAKTNSSQPTKHAQPLAKNANGAKCYTKAKLKPALKTCCTKTKVHGAMAKLIRRSGTLAMCHSHSRIMGR